ncbi:UTP--glucose-1-phosphate uridylyltransferase [Gracilinema caldarium]|uniref:UTP--glucose-1-phosphate uridylyltransferase n=1 Tax=Gracilinema caldarium TaxID=215591 RepID=UPI0026EBAB05|nr:UTP--glucose-1-phosphate uridylyltransferase [Gracilinema caldarium]
MNNITFELHPELAADLRQQGADIERTLKILSILSEHKQTGTEMGPVSLPKEGDERITDLEQLETLVISKNEAEVFFSRFSIPPSFISKIDFDGTSYILNKSDLCRLGIYLYPYTAYGVLNGGSATTYGDSKKNEALSPAAFSLLREDFLSHAEQCKSSPKGITSAFFEADGSPGPSFLLLKMRSLLIHALEYRLITKDYKRPVLPFFQMTSDSTDAKLKTAYEQYRRDPILEPLIVETGLDPTAALSAKQGLIAALTHSSEGFPRRVFDHAYGKPNRGLALPGGHGENFRVLAPVYRELHSQGIRFVYLGNVDNSGYTVDPIELAYFALRAHTKGAEAAFEFSWRTPVDVKGGILVQEPEGSLTVGEIGQRIKADTVKEEEAQGAHVLFNCATGLFNLDYLVNNLETIPDRLPIRVSDQDKEAGKYAQAEQTTWEILGLMKQPEIIAVRKNRRFIAAKMLLETFLASPRGVLIDHSAEVESSLTETSRLLRKGLQDLLAQEYGFVSVQGRYEPRPVAVLKEEIIRRFGSA